MKPCVYSLCVLTFFEFSPGKNGSGKSAVLTGIVVALGERASATCRGNSTKGIYYYNCIN